MVGTGMMVSHGTKGADGAVTMNGEYDDPMSGAKVKARTVTRSTGPDAMTFEMYENRGQGETKTMVIDYVRAPSR